MRSGGQLDHAPGPAAEPPQLLLGHLAIVERDLPPARELLSLLVTLAGDDDGVARVPPPRARARSRPAGPARPRPRRFGDPGQDLGDDRLRLLRARVVGGDHAGVRESSRDLPHQGALLTVAIPAAAEDRDQPSLGQPARRRQRVVQRVGGVGVVDQDRERLPLVDRLEASRDAARAGQGGGRRLGWHAEHMAGADRGECVLDVEVARERHPHLDLPAGTEAAKPRPGRVEGSVERPEVGLLGPARREGEQRRVSGPRQLGGEPCAVGIVEVDHRGARLPRSRTGCALPRSTPPCRAWKSR